RAIPRWEWMWTWMWIPHSPPRGLFHTPAPPSESDRAGVAERFHAGSGCGCGCGLHTPHREGWSRLPRRRATRRSSALPSDSTLGVDVDVDVDSTLPTERAVPHSRATERERPRRRRRAIPRWEWMWMWMWIPHSTPG